ARPDGGARRGPGRGACGRGRRPRDERAAVAGARRRRPARRLGRHGDRARRARPRPRRVRTAPRARTCARAHRARGAHRPPRAHDRRRARGAPGARSRARGDPARRRARAGAGGRRTRRRPDRRERSRRAPCLPAGGPRARRPAGRLRGALAMTADELARALAAAGASGPLSRADLQAALRRHRRRELVRIGGRDLLGLASVEDTVRELSALAEGVLDAAVASVRARLAAEWGEALVPGEGRPAAFVVLGMGKLGGEELNYSSDVDLVYVYERDGEQAAGRTLGQFFSRLAEE